METHLEHEMKSCLEEMEKLQTKAKELQQKKIELETIQQSKISETSPNMNIMKEWLDDYNEAEEYEIYSKINVNVKHHPEDRCKCRWNISAGRYIDPYIKSKSDPCITPCNSKACRSKEDSIRIKMNSNTFIKNKVVLKRNSLESNCQYPSEFMKDFIEATYNLFQIQQKRIEELEDIVHDQIATTLKFDS